MLLRGVQDTPDDCALKAIARAGQLAHRVAPAKAFHMHNKPRQSAIILTARKGDMEAERLSLGQWNSSLVICSVRAT
eukprot:6183574-Pleurochrysis_carterae.AAC.4